MLSPRFPHFLRHVAGFIGLFLVLAAISLLAADMIASLEAGGQLVASRLSDVWAVADPNGPAWFSKWSEIHLPAPLAQMANIFLSLYAWLVTGLAGVLLGCLTGPHRHK